jgi:ribonuclease R
VTESTAPRSTRRPSTRRAPTRRAPATPTGAAASTTGVFRPHVRGFGFVDLDEQQTRPDGAVVTSCFVPPPMTKGLLADDRVDVSYVVEDDGRGTATAVTFRERVRTEVFGVVEDGLVLRLDPHLGSGRWTLSGSTDDLPVGAAVVADITGPAQADPSHEWDDPTSADALLERIRVRHRIAVDYPPEVMAEVEAVAAPGGKRSRGGDVVRRDLRGLPTFTIDSAHSRDLDDALSVYPADPDGGIRVCVHIADVSAHVRPGTALDREALRAATSVYLPGWTRPMLPERLSEDALSLVPDADRDALTVEMRVATDGVVTAADVYATRIRSDTRLTYDVAAEVLAGRPVDGVPDDILDALRWLRTAGARLGVQRLRRGGVEARRVEPELTVEVVEGYAEQVAAQPANPANLLIERLMVSANESVARWLVDRGLPGIFRVHPAPGPEAAPALEAFCSAAGFHPGFGSALTPLGLAALSAQLDAAADETATAVWDVLLGFLGRASYTPDAGLHFGLASDGYLHFTSPIRRYADLAVHRVIHAFLAGRRDVAGFPGADDMAALCAHINAAARTASQAESQLRKAFWLATLARQVAAEPSSSYPGRVTGVSAKGIFVTLDGSRVSGMVAARELPGRGWAVSDDGLALVDAAGDRLGYGDAVTVQIVSADVESGQLELRTRRPAAPAAPEKPAGGRAPRARVRRTKAT